jgi:hypothetical protein
LITVCARRYRQRRLCFCRHRDRVSRSCVGCVVYVPGRSSSPSECERGGEEETIGSSRYIVQTVYASVCFSAAYKNLAQRKSSLNNASLVSHRQTKTQTCRQRPRHGAGGEDKRKGVDGRGGDLPKSCCRDSTRRAFHVGSRLALGPGCPLRYWIRSSAERARSHTTDVITQT